MRTTTVRRGGGFHRCGAGLMQQLRLLLRTSWDRRSRGGCCCGWGCCWFARLRLLLSSSGLRLRLLRLRLRLRLSTLRVGCTHAAWRQREARARGGSADAHCDRSQT